MLINEEKGYIFRGTPKCASTSIITTLLLDSGVTIEGHVHDMAPMSYPRIIANGEISEVDSYHSNPYLFKFSVIRNPLARLVSAFNNRNPEYEGNISEFNYFAMCLFRGEIEDWHYFPQTHQNRVKYCQHDFVLLFENLAEDWQHVLGNTSVSLQLCHENSSAEVDYLSYYDAVLKLQAEQYYSKDLEIYKLISGRN